VNGNDVLNLTKEKYATCETYQDVGRAQGPNSALTFKTWFKRSGLFRYEATTDTGGTGSQHLAVWFDGDRFHSDFSIFAKPKESSNLMLAMAYAMVTAGPCTLLVPGLLMPGSIATLYGVDVGDYEIVSDVDEYGKQCLRIRSDDLKEQKEIWIRSLDNGMLKYYRQWITDQADRQASIEKMEQVLKEPTSVIEMKSAMKDLAFADQDQSAINAVFDLFANNPEPFLGAIKQLEKSFSLDQTWNIEKVLYESVIFDEQIADTVFLPSSPNSR
jgi:hypothetical protein